MERDGNAKNDDLASLGVELDRDIKTGMLQVTGLQPSFPAETSGMVHVGDLIKALRCAKDASWRSTDNLSLEEAHQACSGAVGSTIRLRILRQETEFDCMIELVKPWVPVNRVKLPKCTPRPKPASGQEIQDKIHKGMAKINASQKPQPAEKMTEEEMEARMFQRMMEQDRQTSQAQYAKKGRTVVVRSNASSPGIWRGELWVFLSMLWFMLFGRKSATIKDVEMGDGEGDDDDDDDEDDDKNK